MRSEADSTRYDVLIVGAGPAGLSAALVLGRMRRRTLVLDTDAPAHAVSEGVHGFLGHDGMPPHELRRAAREQLAPYPAVELRTAAARSGRRAGDGAFELTLGDGSSVGGRRLLLAHGMDYGLPELGGVAELWGTKVFHCPYCHGWEVRDQRLAVYGCGARAVHQALLLTSLSEDILLFWPSSAGLDDDRRQALLGAGVGVRTEPVERVDERRGALHVVLAGDAPIARDALFIQPKLALASDLAATLGAEVTEAGSVAVDAAGESGVPGLFAAGDAGAPVQSVAVAAGSGARAAYAVNASLAAGDFHFIP